jgi:hypothetical protein
VIHVARRLGPGGTLTRRTYGHFIDGLDGQNVSAEPAIRAGERRMFAWRFAQ